MNNNYYNNYDFFNNNPKNQKLKYKYDHISYNKIFYFIFIQSSIKKHSLFLINNHYRNECF